MTIDLPTAARSLYHARRDDTRIALDTPRSLDEAYALQAAVDALHDADPIGYKIGATIAPILDAYSLERPFHGPLQRCWQHANGARVRVPRTTRVSAETEIVVGFRDSLSLGADDHAPDEVPSSRIERVVAAIGWVAVGVELVGSRVEASGPTNGRTLIADSGANVAIVVGEPCDMPTDPASIRDYRASLAINGERKATGLASESLASDPLAMVAWLLGQPAFAERGLRAGELVFCGTCTGALPVSPGDRLDAEFGPLGHVTATLV